MKPYYQSFVWKLIVVVGLCVLLMGCMFYLIFTGADVRIRAATRQEETEPTETPDFTPSPEVTPSASPEVTPTSEPQPADSPTPTPSESAEPSPTPDITPTPSASPHISDFDIESTESIQKLINRSHTIPKDYVPADLVVPDVPVYENQQMRREAAEALEEMFAAARKDGYDFYLASGYRSYEKQIDIYNEYVAEKGKEEADRIDAHPSASEHQLGLGADLCTVDGGCAFCYCFEDRDEYAWLQENSWKYGYILRYPDGKESITRIKFSPWHYRYVGKDLAEIIHDQGLCLEEYFAVSAY